MLTVGGGGSEEYLIVTMTLRESGNLEFDKRTHFYNRIFKNSKPFCMNFRDFRNNVYEFCRFEHPPLSAPARDQMFIGVLSISSQGFQL